VPLQLQSLYLTCTGTVFKNLKRGRRNTHLDVFDIFNVLWIRILTYPRPVFCTVPTILEKIFSKKTGQ
jgi:hypothetical protein